MGSICGTDLLRRARAASKRERMQNLVIFYAEDWRYLQTQTEIIASQRVIKSCRPSVCVSCLRAQANCF